MNKYAPCKDCPDRYVKIVNDKPITCHESCVHYKEFKRLKEKEKEQERIERFKERVVADSIVCSMNRVRKKGNRVANKRHCNN